MLFKASIVAFSAPSLIPNNLREMCCMAKVGSNLAENCSVSILPNGVPSLTETSPTSLGTSFDGGKYFFSPDKASRVGTELNGADEREFDVFAQKYFVYLNQE